MTRRRQPWDDPYPPLEFRPFRGGDLPWDLLLCIVVAAVVIAEIVVHA